MDEIKVSDNAGVRTIAIDRPAKRNALTAAMYGALGEAVAGAAASGARAIWLRGSAECFTAGNDLADFARARPGGRSPAIDFLEVLVGAETPIVASVNGAAVGIGTTVLLHCDLVYCSADARFQMPFINLGLCPEAASSLLLPMRAGSLRANALLMLGDPFDAAAALDAGLVNAVLPDAAAADATGAAQAAALAAKPPVALRETRRLLRHWSRARTLEAIGVEAAAFAALLQGAEAREALTAFQEKRKPDFHSASALTRPGEG